MNSRNPELLRVLGWLALSLLCFLAMVVSALAE